MAPKTIAPWLAKGQTSLGNSSNSSHSFELVEPHQMEWTLEDAHEVYDLEVRCVQKLFMHSANHFHCCHIFSQRLLSRLRDKLTRTKTRPRLRLFRLSLQAAVIRVRLKESCGPLLIFHSFLKLVVSPCSQRKVQSRKEIRFLLLLWWLHQKLHFAIAHLQT